MLTKTLLLAMMGVASVVLIVLIAAHMLCAGQEDYENDGFVFHTKPVTVGLPLLGKAIMADLLTIVILFVLYFFT